MKVVEHSAVVGASGRDRGFIAALEVVLGELGFTRTDRTAPFGRWPRASNEPAELEVNYLIPERGAWACLGTSPAMARAIAFRLAPRLQHAIQVFTATARYDDRSLECTVEDRVVRPDGQSSLGTFARELEDSVGGDWGELCDAKAYFAVTAIVGAAIDAWVVGTREGRAMIWDPPASLGDRRLDELALRIRVGVRSELTTIDGRRCIRVKTAEGALTTSFLTDDELARLEPAVAALLLR